jgi:glyoxylase-like metal-dependent hydrolase (beta-lactamase superfamily II)
LRWAERSRRHFDELRAQDPGRRDVIWAGRNLVAKGTPAIVPISEKAYFTRGDSIWKQFNRTRFHDFNNQTTKIGFSPVNTTRFVSGGETVNWQGIDFKVLNTPGYTRGSVSYIADIDSKRYAFVGDLIFGDGKILDLYSFQDSLKSVAGYHGYGARLGQLIASLQLIAQQKPDFLIPSRGPIIKAPAVSIQKLIGRIRGIYQNYLSISAYRWYNQKGVNSLSDHILGPSARFDFGISAKIEKNPPVWYDHFSNSNLVFSQDSTAFLIDCGLKCAYEHIRKLKSSGRLKNINGIFITHYHDDHVNFINDESTMQSFSSIDTIDPSMSIL